MAAFVGAFALFATPAEAGGRYYKNYYGGYYRGGYGYYRPYCRSHGYYPPYGIVGHTMGAMVRPFTLPYRQFGSPSAVADTGNPDGIHAKRLVKLGDWVTGCANNPP